MHKLSQIHIEAARNSTDDFNLFHDKFRWNLIPDNPFGGPIALGFQLGCFIETQIDAAREQENLQISAKEYPLSGYELSFANAVKPDETLSLRLKPGKTNAYEGAQAYSNRLMLLSQGKPVIIGYKREFQQLPQMFSEVRFPSREEALSAPDRSFLNDHAFFIKQKYMIVGNAKNFLTSALAEQSKYIDEFDDKVNFPQMYPLGLISSALLERAKADHYDLRRNPMIYVSHKLCIDKRQLATLRSNDRIVIVVSSQLDIEITNQDTDRPIKVQHCIAYAKDDKPLFYGRVELLPLDKI